MTDSEKDVFCEEAASLKARSAELRKEALARQTEAPDSKAFVGSCIQPDLVDESYAAMKLVDDSGSEFVSVKALGQGTYGYVHKIINSVTGEQFAAKVVHAADALQDLGQEHLALMAARSPNIVAAFGYLTGKDGCVALLLELADLDLSAWLIANKLPSPEAKSEYRQRQRVFGHCDALERQPDDWIRYDERHTDLGRRHPGWKRNDRCGGSRKQLDI